MYVRYDERLAQPQPPTIQIPGGSDYIRWVQRSLNRTGAGLSLTGSVSTDYRDAVRRFQSINGLTPTGQVDERTQNALLKSNERDGLYVLWIQTTLNTLRASGLFAGASVPETGRLGSTTRQAIRGFQQQFAGLLAVDGFVGFKTESLLRGLSGIEPFSGEPPSEHRSGWNAFAHASPTVRSSKRRRITFAVEVNHPDTK